MVHGSLHIDIIFTHILTHIMERDLHGQLAIIKMEIALQYYGDIHVNFNQSQKLK
jgi:hypothetical protein